MYLKSFSLLILVLVKSVILEEDGKTEFVAGSTTQRSPQQQFDDRLTKNSHRLEVLETQIQQIQKSLEDINRQLSVNKNQSDHSFSRQSLPRNCQEIKERGGNDSQTHLIKPEFAQKPFFVRCNMETRGGGWTYIFNRFNGSESFKFWWTAYRNGFGNPRAEFWLGLENQHELTVSEENELLVELVDWDDKKVFAHYTGFSIGSETQGYPIKVLEGYSGDAGDSFSGLIDMKFTTWDKDNDNWPTNCANKQRGGWWYDRCADAKLTGTYEQGPTDSGQGIYWKTFHGLEYSLKEARMMVRPRRS